MSTTEMETHTDLLGTTLTVLLLRVNSSLVLIYVGSKRKPSRSSSLTSNYTMEKPPLVYS
jgi:hypothetical protein